MTQDVRHIRRLGLLAATMFTLRVMDVCIVFGAGFLAYWVRYGLLTPSHNVTLALSFATILSVVVFNLGQAYLTSLIGNFWALSRRVAGHWLLVVLIMSALAFLMRATQSFSRLWVLEWLIFAAAGFLAARLATTSLIQRMQKKGHLSQRIAIIGADLGGLQLFHHLRENNREVQVVGVFDDRMDRLQPEANRQGVTIAGTVDDLIAWARTSDIDCIVIAIPWTGERRLRELIEMLQSLSVELQICPEGLGFVVRSFPMFRNSVATTLGGLPMFTVVRRPLDGWGWLIKDIEDRVLTLMLLPLILPICLIIALLIRLDSEGPCLFRQERSGFNGRNFWVYKFRTMRSEASQAVGQTDAARRDDPRVTRIGRILRRTSLDELPQLINVLKGEMSIIGPRPHALSHDRQFARVISKYYARHRVRPGITGWAQVNGYRGGVEDAAQIRDRVDFDLWYIENWSILFDIKILLMTPFVGLINRNAY